MLTIILRLWFSVHPQLVSSFCVRSYSWNNRFIITFVINKTIIFIIVLEVSQLIHISPHASNRHQIKRVNFSICIACISLPWAHFVCVCLKFDSKSISAKQRICVNYFCRQNSNANAFYKHFVLCVPNDLCVVHTNFRASMSNGRFRCVPTSYERSCRT